MIELTKVERENKVYVNDKVIVLDRETITPSELLEMAGFSSLVYDCYFVYPEEDREGEKRVKKKNKKQSESKPLQENKNLNIVTGMHFTAILKQQQ